MSPVRPDLPSGTVTFLFTDVEGSTRLMEDLGEAGYVEALARHRAMLRRAFAAHAGVEVDTQGDAFLYAFADPVDALRAANAGQVALAGGPVKVRMGLHTGEVRLTGEGYAGRELHRAARIAASGHGGQVVLSAATRALVDGELMGLGEHRLKDFPEPIVLFQVGSNRFPPLKTISNTNLPRPASSFVGRERETQEVVALLREGARLVTLAGVGGSGKTRLAIEAASELVSLFRAGVFWVPLATIRDAGLVTETIAETIGAKTGLEEHIGDREMLLLLDNLEQIIDAAPQLAALVEACPRLHLLCTSRERLRVRGELEYDVPPLTELEAVSLFCQRSHLKADETITMLCQRLDCLPLALELAAARTSVLSPIQILERLGKRLDLLKGGRDAEARQQTLRAAIEWSYDLLNPEEQGLFARLAVFRGGCTLEAAEEVAGADLDVLQSLVDKSLLRHTNERFWMLETIREYALERLEASGEETATRRRLFDWIRALVDTAEPHLREYDHDWMRRIDKEHANIRAALDHLEGEGETQAALQIAGGAFWYWAQYGHLNEGQELLQRLLRDRAPTRTRAKALLAQADLAIDGGDAATGDAAAAEAESLYDELGDESGVAHALLLRGLGRSVAEEWEAGRQYLTQAVERFRGLGDDYFTIESTRRLAWMYESLGDLQRAKAMHEENLRTARRAGRESVAATTLSVLTGYALNEGRVHDAVAMARDCIATHSAAGDVYQTLVDLHRFTRIFNVQSQPEAAVQLLAARASLHSEQGFRVEGWLAAHDREELERARVQLDHTSFERAWNAGKKMTLETAVAFALEASAGSPENPARSSRARA